MTKIVSDILTWLPSRLLTLNRNSKRAVVIALDALLCILSVWIAFSLRFGFWVIGERPDLAVIGIALSLWLPIFYLSGIYRSIFRFAGSGTMVALGNASLVYGVPIIVIIMLFSVDGVPRTIGVIQPILFFLLLCLSRITGRYLLVDILPNRAFKGVRKRVIIYGAGSTGKQLSGSLRDEPGMEVVAYIDDDTRLDGQTLDGVRVCRADRLEELVKRYDVTDILLAMPKNSRAKNRDIVQSLQPLSVHVRTVPRMSELVDGEITTESLREINVIDLLGRDPVPPNALLLGKTIFGKTVLVTGAGGSIGSELCRQIVMMRPRRIILFEMTEYALYAIEQDLIALCSTHGLGGSVTIIPELGNVTNRAQIARIFSRWQPDTVFHAAAYKHVPLVEANPISGAFNNIFGTYFVALEAERTGVAHFILVSTDKAVRPTNIMGATKRVCELVLQALAQDARQTRFTMVRFGNVLNSSGSVVPRFEKQIRAGGPVTLTHRDVTRYFMTIPEAAQLVIQAGAMAEGGEVFVLDMGASVKIIDLARSMIKLSGLAEKSADNPDGDIEIAEVGLRPGEKLFEELLIGDSPQNTAHPRVMRARETMIPGKQLFPRLDELEKVLASGDAKHTMEILNEFVPELAEQRRLASESG